MRIKRTIVYTSLAVIFIYTLLLTSLFIIYSEKLTYQTMDDMYFKEKIQVTETVEERADNLTAHCNETDPMESYCHYHAISNHVYFDINYTNETTDVPGPEEVMRRGEARCVGKSILFSSLMRALDYETQLVYQPEHVCTAVQLPDRLVFFNCHNKEIIYAN